MATHHLQAGVDIVTTSHLLGNASVETTNRYAVVSLEAKRAAVAKAGTLGEPKPEVAGWHSDLSILNWLESIQTTHLLGNVEMGTRNNLFLQELSGSTPHIRKLKILALAGRGERGLSGGSAWSSR